MRTKWRRPRYVLGLLWLVLGWVCRGARAWSRADAALDDLFGHLCFIGYPLTLGKSCVDGWMVRWSIVPEAGFCDCWGRTHMNSCMQAHTRTCMPKRTQVHITTAMAAVAAAAMLASQAASGFFPAVPPAMFEVTTSMPEPSACMSGVQVRGASVEVGWGDCGWWWWWCVSGA